MDIPMNYLVSSGIRKEEVKDFNKSFFKDIYRQALNSIALIIRTNKKKSLFDKSNDIYENILPIYDVQNTIAFTGRRGTGKTSAMISVRNCLLHPNEITDDICEEKTVEEIKSVSFWTLPKMIDASHLDEKEDLLEVILASMLKELVKVSSDRDFNEREYGQKVEELKRRMTKVQNDYDSLIQTNGHTIPASYNMLVQGADKHHIQSEFKDIIDNYLLILSKCIINKEQKKTTEKYLVICIDDIDMYPGDPMLIMQCIYRYFTLPNVLVMTSWNYNMLYQYIYKHYYKRMHLEDKEEDTEYSERERLCHEQCNDYLRKIIPFDKRIVMPSWRKSDYRDIIEKNISIDSKDKFEKNFKEEFPRLYPGRLYNALKHMVNNGKTNISVKEFIFLLLADRTGIYLDASGYKPHFMEPDGLRSTFELFDTLYTMNNIRNGDGNINRYNVSDNKEKIKQNFKNLLDTFYFKLLPSLRLNDEESDFFNMLYKEKLSRRSKAIIDYYYILYKRKKKDDTSIFDYENTIEDHCSKPHLKIAITQDYSIGELFRILHHSTRLGVFSKQLVKAILASYSFILPYYFDEGTFKYYRDLNIEEGKDNIDEIIFKGEKFETLFRIFGGSLLGNWVYEMFGFKSLHIKFSIETLKKLDEDGDISCKCALLNILMFIRIDKLKEMEEIEFVKKEDYYELTTEVDPSAFFINAMRFEDFCEEIKRFIVNDFDDIIDKRKRKLSNYFRCGKYEENVDDNYRQKYPIFALPLHQVDMIYNVVKRSIKDIMYVSDSELRIKSHEKIDTSENVNKTVELLYQNIIRYLSRVEKCYPVYIDGKEADQNIFVERFTNLGEKNKLWEKIGEANPPGNEEYRRKGKYNIRLTISEYCSFVTTEMSKRDTVDNNDGENKFNEQKSGNVSEIITLKELVDKIKIS